MSASKVNIYKHMGVWCYALWIDGEFDSSDTIGCYDDASEQEVRGFLNDNFVFASDVKIVRVEDMPAVTADKT